MDKHVPTWLEKFVNQIDTRRYCDYKITDDSVFCQDSSIKKASDTKLICDHKFQKQHKQTRKILILLCKNSTDRYHLNILRIITIIYHIYIECESYNLAYKKPKLLRLTGFKWDDHD